MLRRLTDHIHYLPAEASTDRPILAAVLGRDAVLMVDAGNSPTHAELFLDSLMAATGRTPDWVVLTHWHWDHTFGLSRLDCPSIGHVNIGPHLAGLQGLPWDDQALYERVRSGQEIAFCAEHIRKEYGDHREIEILLPTITFERRLDLDLGGITCEFHWMPTDHSDDAVAVYVREEKTLFVGDSLGSNLYAPKPYYSPVKVQEMVAWIRAFDVDWYVGSHASPEREDEFWAANRILEVVARLVQRGLTDRGALMQAVERRMGPCLPDDYVEVVDLFLNHKLGRSPSGQLARSAQV